MIQTSLRRPAAWPVLACLAFVLLASSAANGQIQAAAKPAPAVARASGARSSVAADSSIHGPRLGFVFDRSARDLRPLMGILGSAYVGEAVSLGIAPRVLEVAPDQQHALGVEAASGGVFVIDLRSDPPVSRELPEAMPHPGYIVFGALGSTAALYQRESKQIEVVGGLPDGPIVQRRIELRSLPGVLTALAVSDDGSTLVAAVSELDGGGALYVAAGEELSYRGAVGRVSSIVFLGASFDIVLADVERNEVVHIRDVRTGGAWSVVGSRGDGVARPSVVAAAGNKVLAVSATDRTIAAMPLDGGPIEFIDCPCNPTGLHALGSGTVFRLTDLASGPMYVLDTQARETGSPGGARVLFVPVPNRPAAAGNDLGLAPRGRSRR